VLKTIALACSVAVLTGCATDPRLWRDRRDAPWDPPAGRSLFEQLPAWDGAAQKRCGAHLPESERGGRSDRC
jgi:hypothetical protein